MFISNALTHGTCRWLSDAANTYRAWAQSMRVSAKVMITLDNEKPIEYLLSPIFKAPKSNVIVGWKLAYETTKQLGKAHWKAKVVYTIKDDRCDCPNAKYRHGPCKHLRAVQALLDYAEYVDLATNWS